MENNDISVDTSVDSSVYIASLLDELDNKGGPLTLKGEMSVVDLFDHLFERDNQATLCQIGGGFSGLIKYKSMTIYYGGAAHHPALLNYPSYIIGSPTVEEMRSYWDKKENPDQHNVQQSDKKKGFFRRFFGL